METARRGANFQSQGYHPDDIILLIGNNDEINAEKRWKKFERSLEVRGLPDVYRVRSSECLDQVEVSHLFYGAWARFGVGREPETYRIDTFFPKIDG